MKTFQPSPIDFTLSWMNCWLHISNWICNCRCTPLIILFLGWILVFINDVWILLYNCLASVVTFLHVKLLFWRIHGYVVVIVWSGVCTAADGILCSTHFILVLAWINLIILPLSMLLCRLDLCYYMIIVFRIIFH